MQRQQMRARHSAEGLSPPETVLSLAMVGAAACSRSRAADGPADLLVLNGRVYTAVDGSATAEAVAVRGNKILRVGTDRDLEAHARRAHDRRRRATVGPCTRVQRLARALPQWRRFARSTSTWRSDDAAHVQATIRDFAAAIRIALGAGAAAGSIRRSREACPTKAQLDASSPPTVRHS